MKQMLIVLCLITGTAVAQATTLISKELIGIPGKEATMITVQYDRGASDVIHRHNAHVSTCWRAGSSCRCKEGSN
jgi:hypothetical protein